MPQIDQRGNYPQVIFQSKKCTTLTVIPLSTRCMDEHTVLCKTFLGTAADWETKAALRILP